MKKIFAALKRSPKRAMAVAVVFAAVLVPATLFAWGPDRATFTEANPASYVTFNSITDNKVVGDERQFVNARDASITQDGSWSKDVTVQPGKEYTVRVYVHNNAADNLNLKAINTRVSASVPTTTGTNVAISGFVSADNAQPQKVWADVNFKSGNGEQFNLAYVAGSARVYNNGYAKGGNGQPLPDSIVTSAGAQIGYDSANGEVPGCFKYVNYVYFKVKPQFAEKPSFEIQKTVSKHGENKWAESVQANSGDKVDYRIQYKNTGETQQDNVVVKDVLPKGASYVAGSTKLYNTVNPSGKVLNDDLTTAKGINIGSHAAGATSFVVFTAKMNATDLVCGSNTLINKARVETDYGSKEDSANVTMTKPCQPGTITVCDTTTNTQVTISEKDFDSNKHSKDMAACQGKGAAVTLPETGTDDGLIVFGGLTALAAGLGYAFTSKRVRELLIG